MKTGASVKIRLLILLVFLTLLASFVMADQTQLYSKIYLNPYYKESLTGNVLYNYTLSVNPPDKITQVFSATISWQLYLMPSLNVTMLVNNKSCNNANYYIDTAYVGAGLGLASFDCSNVINKSGNYSIQLKMSRNTGAINGWLDLAYTNKPIGSMDVFGTEYNAGDDGTIFLLLKDPNGIPITNATCTLDIYYPLSANLTHPEWINNGLMRYLEEGLYYYDFVAPLQSGIYMVNAQCAYVTTDNMYYTLSSGLAPTRNATYGVYTGDPFVLNDYSEWLYTQCDSGTIGGGTKGCVVDYTWNLTAGGLTGNITQLYAQYLGENNGFNSMNMFWFNWSNSQWVKLPNNLTFSATGSSGVPIGVDEYLSNLVPLEAISPLTRVRIRLNTTSGSTFKQWDNFFALKSVQYGTTIQDLKGSGEIHVSSSSGGQGANRYFVVDTCQGLLDGRCGFFTNDDEFDLVEGEIEDYFNVTASSTRPNVTISYETPFSVDCTALYWIKNWNGTEWVDFTDYTTYSQPSYQNCIINLNKDFTTGTTYEFWVKMDNYMKWEVDYTKQMTDTLSTLIPPLCANRNFTYVNPITETTNISADPITDFCHRTYDDLYYISFYYNDSLPVDLAGEYASYLQEMRFYRQELFNRYGVLKMVIDNSSQVMISMLSNLSNITQINLTEIKAQLTNITGEIAIEKGIMQSILDYLTNTIYPYLTNIWNKLLGIETQLNTTINITTNINTTTNLIKNDTSTIITDLQGINNSMIQGFAEKDAHIQNAYDNMTSQISNLSQNVSNNFNTTWGMIQALNTSQMGNNTLILSYLANITTTLNNTQNLINNVNSSLYQQILNTSNNTQNLINNLNISNQARFDQLDNFLQNLTIQISNNHNLTQANLTDLANLLLGVNLSLTTDISNLNLSLQNTRTDILAEINQSYQYMIAMNQTINSNLLLINSSLSNAIQIFRNEVQNNFSNMFSTLTMISGDLNGTKAELQSGMNNLSLQLTNTNQSIQLKLDALNISMQEGFAEKDAHIQSAYDNITSQINNLSLVWDGNFSDILNRIDNLSIQIDNNQNITQSNISAINTYLTNLNISVQQGFNDLNTSISNTETNIINQINLINSSLSDQIQVLSNSTTDNFNTTFWWLSQIDLNINNTKEEIMSNINNLSLQLNDTRTEINSNINILNTSLWNKMDGVENKTDYAIELIQNLSLQYNSSNQGVLDYLSSMNTNITIEFSDIDTEFNTTWEMINNVTQQINFTPVLNAIDDVSIQISANHNITQQNITQIFNQINGLNESCTENFNALNSSISNLSNNVDGYIVWLNDTLIEMKSEISNIENMTTMINQTITNINTNVTWIVQFLNVTEENLHLTTQAPSRCLLDTNWILRAYLTDQYGVTLSPTDNAYCNITTDLWGTENMTFDYVHGSFKYIHVCDPDHTIFNWSVSCNQTG